jgi:hypothetical protein
MLNTEIKYKTSTDYKELYGLLKDGNIIIGFMALNIGGVPNMEYSTLVQMHYTEKWKKIDLGKFTFDDNGFDKIGFELFCIRENVRFIPLN